MPTNHDFINVLETQQGAAYIFGAEDDPHDPNSPKEHGTDCSEYGQWGTGRLGVDYPDGTWNQVSFIRQHGLLIPVDQALRTVGAALFYFSGDPFHGSRPAEAHTAYSLGDNAHDIEARGKAYGTGIFKSTGRSWNYAGLIPGLTYTTEPGTPAPHPTTGGTAPGFPGRVLMVTHPHPMTGSDVRSVQQRLHDRGWKITVDGAYGGGTEKVVVAFQREKHLSPDGKVGPATWQALWTSPVT